VNRKYPKILRKRKRRIQRRLDPERRWTEAETPMMSASNIHFEISERSQALNYGGIGAMHPMGQKLGLVAVPACHCVVAGTNCAQRSENHLSDHGL